MIEKRNTTQTILIVLVAVLCFSSCGGGIQNAIQSRWSTGGESQPAVVADVHRVLGCVCARDDRVPAVIAESN
jgi:hypothetical protein